MNTLTGPPCRKHAYVRAPFIEHSLDFTHDYQSANDNFREGL
jgi:hypothetical protein